MVSERQEEKMLPEEGNSTNVKKKPRKWEKQCRARTVWLGVVTVFMDNFKRSLLLISVNAIIMLFEIHKIKKSSKQNSEINFKTPANKVSHFSCLEFFLWLFSRGLSYCEDTHAGLRAQVSFSHKIHSYLHLYLCLIFLNPGLIKWLDWRCLGQPEPPRRLIPWHSRKAEFITEYLVGAQFHKVIPILILIPLLSR